MAGASEASLMTHPASLYHYTSIDVLALILSNRTIRLRRLDLMDDPHEAESADFGRAGKYIMVSCWTDATDEELLTWSLYTGVQGIRIRLPANPFDEPFRLTNENTPPFLQVENQMSCINPAEIVTERHLIVPTMPRLLEVQYTDEKEKLHPKIFYQNERGVAVALSELGKHKRTLWSFQREWRYVLEVFPMTSELYRHYESRNIDAIVSLALDAMRKGQEPDIHFIDIPIKQTSLEQLEVTLGPKMSKGHRILVESLIQKYAPSATIRESSFHGNII